MSVEVAAGPSPFEVAMGAALALLRRQHARLEARWSEARARGDVEEMRRWGDRAHDLTNLLVAVGYLHDRAVRGAPIRNHLEESPEADLAVALSGEVASLREEVARLVAEVARLRVPA